MSSSGEIAAALSNILTSFDGAVAGISFAVFTVGTWASYFSSAAALRRISAAPSPPISDLRSLLLDDSSGEPLVVLRGHVAPANPFSSLAGFVSGTYGDKGVILEHTQKCLYNDWRGTYGWSLDIGLIVRKRRKEATSYSLKSVPFILEEGGLKWPRSSSVHVSLDGSSHELPLTTVFHRLLPVQATHYTFLQALFGYGYPVAMLDEEKILPIGEEITAVGICRVQDGKLQIKSCPELPIFLSKMTKDEIEADLAVKTKILFWSGVVLGTISVSVLGYAIFRNWWRWKAWRQRRSEEPHIHDEVQSTSDNESGEVPDGELCIICLMRRRRSAFVPCGHRVCCPRCAMTVERDASPKCPMCRQHIRSSIRIFDS